MTYVTCLLHLVNTFTFKNNTIILVGLSLNKLRHTYLDQFSYEFDNYFV